MAVTAFRKRIDVWEFGEQLAADRYFYVPKVILLRATIAAAGGLQRGMWKWSAAALLCVGLAANSPPYRFTPYRDFHWYEQCADIRAGKELYISINPGWTFKYRRGSDVNHGPL